VDGNREPEAAENAAWKRSATAQHNHDSQRFTPPLIHRRDWGDEVYAFRLLPATVKIWGRNPYPHRITKPVELEK